jgi:hypothetical protein
VRGRKSQLLIEIEPATKQIMEGLCRAQKTPLGLARRVQGMLLLQQGNTFVDAAKGAGLAERHLRKWAKRFKQDGLAGLNDKGRPGRPPRFSP